ncbi:MAG: hypothetical protein Kow0031_09720 [Anaerolineae bacterium]
MGVGQGMRLGVIPEPADCSTSQIMRYSAPQQKDDLWKWLLAVAAFGAAAFLVRWANFTIPVIGTTIRVDAKEVFVTLGAAITGPIGGVIIGVMGELSVLSSPYGLGIIASIAHASGGIMVGLLYRVLYNRTSMPTLLVGWSVVLLAYYFIFLIPIFLIILMAFQPQGVSAVLGQDYSFFQAYALLAEAAFYEAVAVLAVTSISLFALPEKYRRPSGGAATTGHRPRPSVKPLSNRAC